MESDNDIQVTDTIENHHVSASPPFSPITNDTDDEDTLSADSILGKMLSIILIHIDIIIIEMEPDNDIQVLILLKITTLVPAL